MISLGSASTGCAQLLVWFASERLRPIPLLLSSRSAAILLLSAGVQKLSLRSIVKNPASITFLTLICLLAIIATYSNTNGMEILFGRNHNCRERYESSSPSWRTEDDGPLCRSQNGSEFQEYSSKNVLRGSFNSWGTLRMQLVADYTWIAREVSFRGDINPRFKFDVSGDWIINFGDSNRDGIAKRGGSDIIVRSPSVLKTITFNDATLRYTVQ
eukprot:IDg22681t1